MQSFVSATEVTDTSHIELFYTSESYTSGPFLILHKNRLLRFSTGFVSGPRFELNPVKLIRLISAIFVYNMHQTICGLAV